MARRPWSCVREKRRSGPAGKVGAPRALRDIAELARTADRPERLHRLIRLVEDEAGYALYRAVSGAEAALSDAERAALRFRHADFEVDAEIRRAEFEAWTGAVLPRARPS